MGSTNRLFISIAVVAALAIGFWVLLLGPKREQANELGTQIDSLHLSLEEAQGKAIEAEAAKRDFGTDYRQLVVLGKAVPAGDETASLLVQLNQIAVNSDVKFETFQLEGTGEAAAIATPTPTPAPTPTATPGSAVPAAATVPPTEVAAATMPLGASIGSAGLAVMPYSLSFRGDFFHVADFIHGIDRLVHTTNSKVAVDGRLITLNGFALSADGDRGFPYLEANFKVTTYLIPPGQGLTAGATPAEPVPAPSTATPASEAGGGEAPASSSEPVAAQ